MIPGFQHVVAAVAAALLVVSCAASDGPRPVEGSTYWIDSPKQTTGNELFLKVYTDRNECRAAFDEDMVDECVPIVDRATGQVRLAMQTLNRSDMVPYPLPLGQEHVQVAHNKRPIQEGSKSGYELKQHGQRRAGQLFILLLDGSSSMYDDDAKLMTQLYRALLNPKVKDAFYPDDAQTGVVLLRFTSRVTGLDGGAPVVLESKRQYEEMIKSHLFSFDRGWTHFYEAVDYAIGPLMETQSVKDWLAIHTAEPTIVALTDGFNNHSSADTCATNVPRLQSTLEGIEVARNLPLGSRPTIYTVGLGRPLFRNLDEIPRGPVRKGDLCGKHADDVINGYLEGAGIDNNSLRWIAARGGGESYVRNNTAGLAEVFQASAAMRYQWYTVSYKVDPFYHRQKFEVRLRLLSYANAEATVEVFPSGWLDAPTGERATGSRWAQASPLRQSFGLVVPLLGGLVFFAFLGPAGFNARRAVFRRQRGKGPPPGPAA